jgi:hypothetical protein
LIAKRLHGLTMLRLSARDGQRRVKGDHIADERYVVNGLYDDEPVGDFVGMRGDAGSPFQFGSQLFGVAVALVGDTVPKLLVPRQLAFSRRFRRFFYPDDKIVQLAQDFVGRF